jgi:hypothetical protein
MSNALTEAWAAPVLGPDASDELLAIDPRVITNHAIGQLPCPPNPAPPDGWRYWGAHEKVPPALGALTVKMLHDAKDYPMGAFVQTRHEGELVAARVEWHDLQGASGLKGCFRGVNLLRRVAGAANV